eukprot:TRINITY_DN541_c0_g2_i2.p1 TRINITY_DN541_c0_g2~~TRINITY_DN541_c0_g2_i2.p1  ORF type:complete len:551 (+),score=168.96 TRINITY_DN541_c0_g2_i2:1045-2697(+)
MRGCSATFLGLLLGTDSDSDSARLTVISSQISTEHRRTQPQPLALHKPTWGTMTMIRVAGKLLAALALLWLLRAWRHKRALQHALRALPGPPTHWLLGNLGKMKPGPSTYLQMLEWNAEFQKPFVVWLASSPTVMCNTPDSIAAVLKSDTPKSSSYDFARPWLGNGLLTNNDPVDWKRKRRLITPAFHFDVLKEYVRIFADNTARLAQQWEAQLAAGELVVDMQAEMTFLSLDNIGETAMGVPFDALTNKQSEFVTATLAAAKLLIMRIFNPLLGSDFVYGLTPSGRENAAALRILHAKSEEALNKRMRELESGAPLRTKYFLDILLGAKDETGKKLTFKEMRDEIDTFMFEGHDTTSCGLMWTLWLLGKHPEYQKQVQTELDEHFGKAEKGKYFCPSTEELNKLKFLRLVLRESHRVYPPVPGVSRNSDGNVSIDGTRVPPNVRLGVDFRLLHRNPAVWERPDDFWPERHLQEQQKEERVYTLVPFSAGSRNCIGQNFAELEEKTVLAILLHHFWFESVGEAKPMSELVLRNAQPLKIRVTPRSTRVAA